MGLVGLGGVDLAKGYSRWVLRRWLGWKQVYGMAVGSWALQEGGWVDGVGFDWRFYVSDGWGLLMDDE